MKTDSLFYRLLQAAPTLAFDLAGIELAAAEGYRFNSQEVKPTAFRLDGVVEPPAGQTDAPRAYVEVQFQPDEGFYLRLFSEILLHLGQYPTAHPWYAMAVYPSEAAERIAEAAKPLLALPNLRRVYLDRLPLLQGDNPKLWLVGLIVAEHSQIQPIVGKIKSHHAGTTDDCVDWLDLLETVLIYKLPQFNREEIRKMLNFEDVELKQTRFYQDVFAEGYTAGFSEAEAKGEATLLLRLLERKFQTVPESARRRIEAADAETLLAWGERILEANSLDDIWAH